MCACMYHYKSLSALIKLFNLVSSLLFLILPLNIAFSYITINTSIGAVEPTSNKP